MNLPFSRAPHAMGAPGPQSEAPNAALLIDFDNVTMGMRSDLSKELKTLLNSDIIKGKVTVQRAYADWRRYPQYIVPLSENSVDLIFAPAYGSSKKNATDIRMAIDGMELVFIRPEIGTFILLTGDSDFSSLVLKLKEYGKYVIGVGIQESSSDILVQNCDEYYSYTSLTGLRKTTDSGIKAADPWVLVEKAAEKMVSRSDVMRSDRLKQVMIEIDPTFDEGNFGFSKFSRFLSEAGSRDLIKLRKLENGQYEVRPKAGRKDDDQKDRGTDQGRADSRDRSKEKSRVVRVTPGKGRGRGKVEGKSTGKATENAPETKAGETPVGSGGPLQTAYGLLKKALEGLSEGNGGEAVRDSDLKRKMLELEPTFDEGELGFGKFSRFLRQAHDHEVVDLEKREEGTYQVSVRPGSDGDGAAAVAAVSAVSVDSGAAGAAGVQDGSHVEEGAAQGAPDEKLPEEEFRKRVGARASVVKGLGPRRGERKGRKGQDGPPPLLDGQVVSLGGKPGGDKGTPSETTAEASGAPTGGLDVSKMGLPTDGAAIISYLTNSYKGVGKKTAESLAGAFGSELFAVLKDDPDRITAIVSGRRAEQLFEAWKLDYQRRSERGSQGAGSQSKGENKRVKLSDGIAEKAATEKAAVKKAAAEKAAVKKAAAETTATETAVPEKPATETAVPEKPATETAVTEKPASARRRTRRGGRSRNR